MIYVERVPLPPAIAERMKIAQQKITAQHEAMEKSKRLQQRGLQYTEFYRVRDALEAMFRNKCAYCETLLTGAPGDVENFRPKSFAENGDVSREGYWWLVYVWENLLLACGRCNRLHKMNKFPIDGPPALPHTVGDDLRRERPLLIDPTLEDPSELLWFHKDGQVVPLPYLDAIANSKERQWRIQRALTTIDVLGLNRPAIVQDRRRQYDTTQTIITALGASTATRHTKTLSALTQLLDPDAPYRAATSQWVAEAGLRGTFSKVQDGPVDEFLIRHGAVPQVVQRVLSVGKPSGARARTAKQRAIRKSSARRPTAVVEAPRAPVSVPVFVHSVSIRNFKGIKQLDLTLPVNEPASKLAKLALTSPEPAANAESSETESNTVVTTDPSSLTRTGWFVLLGENSAGKSSVLEAIALALMGRERLHALVQDKRISLEKLVHQPQQADQGIKSDQKKKKAKSKTKQAAKKRPGARILIGLESTTIKEIDLRITEKSFRFHKGGEAVPTLVRGYGYVRLLPRPGEPPSSSDDAIRCDNLFDPRAPLCDAESWMATLPYDDTSKSVFDVAAGAVLNLLPGNALAYALPENEEQVATGHLEPRDHRVVMVLKDRELRLDQLSAGYQSVIALAADIMAGISTDRLFDMREACGIVLLDEVGTQLHPSWRMRAIGDLRNAFPRMQFIATTHEPLCLKAIGREEIVVLKRDAARDEVTAIKSFQDPRALRIDQILTSPLFGLDSTIDPGIDDLFRRYFDLLALSDRATPLQRQERLDLERELAPHRGLGYTRSDQLVYALLEQYLADEGRKTLEDVSQVPKDVRERVFNVWRSVRSYRQARR